MSGFPFPPCSRCGRLPTFTGEPQCACSTTPDEARQIIRALHRQTMRDPPKLGIPPLRLTSEPAPARPSRRLPLFEEE